MSEPALVSPLLDGFTMGQPMGAHDGVSCCPAIREEKKYIVKIITIPPSQTQLDALLLAGAYKDPADAMEYYRQVSEDVLKEAEFLKKLSQLDGFLSYESWQLVPITRGRLGYQVYLVGSYKRTLEKYLRKNPVTHLEAINLGLDLCAALTVCRQAGSLYVALKPGNIFVSDKKQYRIGDLGFIPMDALSYTALPKKYQSRYTPPELFDPMEPLNLTADTYAVGMILYQLYNDGQLPHRDKAPEEGLPTPANADYELAEIIMKAIHPDPKSRWDSPADLGKALAAYMQRNAVNDTPITPHTPLDAAAIAALGETIPKEAPKAEAPDETSETPAPETTEEAPAPEPETPEPEPQPEQPAEEPTEQPAEPSTPEEPAAEAPASEPESEPPAEAPPEEPEAPPQEAPEAPQNELPTTEPLTYDEIMSMDVDSLEELIDEPVEEVPSAPPTPPQPPKDDFAGILDKAENLIQHETPVGVIVPQVEETDPFAFAKDDSDLDDEDIPRDPLMPEEETKKPSRKSEKKYADPKYKRRAKKLISTLTFLLALSMAGLAGFWYYQNIYLQAIEKILINGTRDQLTVTVDTQVKDSMLTVTCSDSHGNSSRQPLSGGTAIFTDLTPSTVYTIQLDVSGFHKLTGKTSDVFTTDATTNILSFTSTGGTEDGSVVLNFTAEGDEPDRWKVSYEAEGEDAKEVSFQGHSVEISNLSVGKMYTFTLDAGKNLTLGGQKTLQFMGSRLILAENLRVSASSDSEITLTWDAPGDVVVDSWDVRCYSDSSKGYDERQTVTDTQAVFVGIDPANSYTLEVVASGMTKPTRIGITVNPIRIENLTVQDTDARKLTASWDFAGTAPKGGWLLLYTIDGGSQSVVKADKATADITPRIPGAKYSLTLQAANGTSVLGGTQTYTCPQAADFDQFGFDIHSLQADLLVTPEDSWHAEDIDSSDFTTSFSLGDSISVALRNSASFYLPGTEVEVLYAIRDSYGNVLSDYTSTQKLYWKNIWNGGNRQNGELTLPKVPDQAGSYVLDLYIEGMQLAKLPFTIG